MSSLLATPDLLAELITRAWNTGSMNETTARHPEVIVLSGRHGQTRVGDYDVRTAPFPHPEESDNQGDPEGRFDLAVIDPSIEYLSMPFERLEAARRLLRPAGVLVVVADMLAFNATTPSARRQLSTSAPSFIYGLDQIRSLMFAAGFGSVSAHPIRAGKASEATLSRAIAGRVAFVASVRDRGETQPGRYLLSIVMPAFNEKRTFSEVFKLVYAKELPDLDKEIIIVESNSTDGTRDDVLAAGTLPGVRVILQDRPQGKGFAVREGLASAKGDFVLIQDADLEYDVDDYDLLLEPLVTNRAAFVLGVRHGGDGGGWKMRRFNNQPLVSHLMNLGQLFFTGLFNLVYQQRVSDPFTMYKVFRRDCIGGLRLEANRFDFDWELMGKLVRRGFVPVEVPVNYISRSFSEGKKVSFLRDPITWLWACIKFRFSDVS